jgi:hypothetical protein
MLDEKLVGGSVRCDVAIADGAGVPNLLETCSFVLAFVTFVLAQCLLKNIY